MKTESFWASAPGVLVILWFGACASSPEPTLYWEHPEHVGQVEVRELNADKYECKRETSYMREEGRSGGYAYGHVAEHAGERRQYLTYNREMFDDCMRARGWEILTEEQIRHRQGGPQIERPGDDSRQNELANEISSRPTGRGLIIAGSSALGGGVLALALGITFMRIGTCPETGESFGCRPNLTYRAEGAAFVSLGALAIAAGVPMLTVGALRNKKWRAGQNRLSLFPSVGGGGGHWGAGFALRF